MATKLKPGDKTFNVLTAGWDEASKKALLAKWNQEIRMHKAFEAQKRAELKEWGLQKTSLMKGLKSAQAMPTSRRYSRSELLQQRGIRRLTGARQSAIQLKAIRAAQISSVKAALKRVEGEMSAVSGRKNPYRLKR